MTGKEIPERRMRLQKMIVVDQGGMVVQRVFHRGVVIEIGVELRDLGPVQRQGGLQRQRAMQIIPLLRGDGRRDLGIGREELAQFRIVAEVAIAEHALRIAPEIVLNQRMMIEEPIQFAQGKPVPAHRIGWTAAATATTPWLCRARGVYRASQSRCHQATKHPPGGRGVSLQHAICPGYPAGP
jgi:hypothetical protein